MLFHLLPVRSWAGLRSPAWTAARAGERGAMPAGLRGHGCPRRGGCELQRLSSTLFSFKNQNQESSLPCSATLKESPRPGTAGRTCPACLFFFWGGCKNADYFLKCRCGTRMKRYCQQLTLISLKAKIHSTVVISPGISSNSKSTLN